MWYPWMNGPAGAESASNDLTSLGRRDYSLQILSRAKEQANLQKLCTASSRSLKRREKERPGFRRYVDFAATATDSTKRPCLLVGSEGTVLLDWPVELCESSSIERV
jgi:hypothetical protein